MARPISTKLTYFSHDCNMRQDKALHFLCAKYKSIAPYAVYNIILETIFGSSEGYFMQWTEREIVLLSDRIYLSIDDTLMIINDTLTNDLFNINLFKKYNILTSKELQRRYLRMCERRKMLIFINEYLLIDYKSELENTGDYKNSKKIEKLLSAIHIISQNEATKEKIQDLKTTVNVTLTPINAELSTQSKSKSKIESINTTYSAIFDQENFDNIFPAYQKYILINDFNPENEIANITARLGGENNPEKYNAVMDCLNFIKKTSPITPAGEPIKKVPDTIEEVKEKLTGRVWQDTVCMTYQLEPEKFMDFTLKWIILKEASDNWHYPINYLKQYLIEAYKKEIENGKRKNNNSRKSSYGNTDRTEGFKQQEFGEF